MEFLGINYVNRLNAINRQEAHLQTQLEALERQIQLIEKELHDVTKESVALKHFEAMANCNPQWQIKEENRECWNYKVYLRECTLSTARIQARINVIHRTELKKWKYEVEVHVPDEYLKYWAPTEFVRPKYSQEKRVTCRNTKKRDDLYKKFTTVEAAIDYSYEMMNLIDEQNAILLREDKYIDVQVKQYKAWPTHYITFELPNAARRSEDYLKAIHNCNGIHKLLVDSSESEYVVLKKHEDWRLSKFCISVKAKNTESFTRLLDMTGIAYKIEE